MDPLEPDHVDLNLECEDLTEDLAVRPVLGNPDAAQLIQSVTQFIHRQFPTLPDADYIANDTVTTLILTLQKKDDIKNITAYALTIAKRMAQRALASRHDTLQLDALALVDDQASSPEQWVLTNETSHMIQTAIAALPQNKRAIMTLYSAGFTAQEIAQIRSISVEDVRSLRQLAIRQLRRDKTLAQYFKPTE